MGSITLLSKLFLKFACLTLKIVVHHCGVKNPPCPLFEFFLTLLLQFFFYISNRYLLHTPMHCRTWLKISLVHYIHLVPPYTERKLTIMNVQLRHSHTWFTWLHLGIQFFDITIIKPIFIFGKNWLQIFFYIRVAVRIWVFDTERLPAFICDSISKYLKYPRRIWIYFPQDCT